RRLPRMTETASIDAPIVRLVAPDGTAVGDVEVGLSENERRELLRLMIRSRRLDRECWALQRQGELTVYPPFEGQEAAQVGSAFALGPDDFVFPSLRERAAAAPATACSPRAASWGGRSCAAWTWSSTSSAAAGRGTAARTTQSPRG